MLMMVFMKEPAVKKMVCLFFKFENSGCEPFVGSALVTDGSVPVYDNCPTLDKTIENR
jgi:hypothetical protein